MLALTLMLVIMISLLVNSRLYQVSFLFPDGVIILRYMTRMFLSSKMLTLRVFVLVKKAVVQLQYSVMDPFMSLKFLSPEFHSDLISSSSIFRLD